MLRGCQRALRRVMLFCCCVLSSLGLPNDARADAGVSEMRSVLILHEAAWQPGVEALARIIESRWNFDVEVLELDSYQSGMGADAQATIVINEGNSPIPPAFWRDAPELAESALVWFGAGFEAAGLPAPQKEQEPFQAEALRYKGVSIEYHDRLSIDLAELAELEGVQELAHVVGSDGAERPLVVRLDGARNMLIFAVRNPPRYYSTDGGSLVFIDALHRVLGPARAGAGRLALVRLEDVNAETYFAPDQLRRAFNLLHQREIPFHVAVIPKYVDPIRSLERGISDARRFSFALRDAVDKQGAVLVQHGFTHQVRDEISGIGFEFWDGERNAPLEGESEAYVLNRIVQAKAEMRRAGLPVPDIWETPHYAYSALANSVLADVYPLRYEPAYQLGSVPFPLMVDGAIHIPETLGYVESSHDIDTIKERLAFLSVLEEPVVASFFWHPWRPLDELQELLDEVEGKGFHFVDAYEMLDIASPRWRRSGETGYRLMTVLTWSCLLIFVFGTVSHFLRRLTLMRNVRASLSYEAPSIEDLQARGRGALPSFAILVPAREETRVIKNTIDSLERLDYPRELLRIVVITDAREEPDPEIGKTTYDIATERAAEINEATGCDLIRVALVPDWYSGILLSSERTHARSTKGRALNWALQWIESDPDLSRIEFLGVVDADGRLSPHVLREAAGCILEGARLLQGPVLQISNFSNVTPIGRLAGLELANYHFTSLAERRWFSRFPKFLAGTNYFIEKDAMVRVGGWDQTALVEDADLAVRLYQTLGLKLEWLWSAEIEQTAPNFSIYKRQRERWVRGHLALARPIWRSQIPGTAKSYLLAKIVSSQFRFVFDIGFPFVALFLFLAGYMADVGGAMSWLSVFLLIGAFMIWDSYGFTYRQIAPLDPNGRMMSSRYRESFALYLLFMPYIFVQIVPRLLAVWNLATKQTMEWYKTERSREA